LVLRGGNRGTNYHLESIQESAAELTNAGLPDRLMVDCSHANSSKDFRRQSEVLKAVASQVDQKSDHVMGVMIESHLVEGNQKLSADRNSLTYGQSVTDACISIETTAELLGELAASVAKARLN
jgi:3-deoxy-7-phosphoheptulonate synthase